LRYHSEGVLINRDVDLVLGDELLNMAYLKLAQGELPEAASFAWQSLELFRQNDDGLAVAGIVVWCAHFKRATGRRREGVQLLAAAAAFCQRSAGDRIGHDLYHTDRPDRDRVLQQLKSELLASDFATAWAEGIGLTADEALDRGFSEPAARQTQAAPVLTPLRAVRERFGGLTAREREIAACVAGGGSNREIASDLVLSERTVEAHIGNILSKLQLTSRTQIATWALQKGLVQLPPTAMG
jgi:DNA-binding CsgD family transcriptional regulator